MRFEMHFMCMHENEIKINEERKKRRTTEKEKRNENMKW